MAEEENEMEVSIMVKRKKHKGWGMGKRIAFRSAAIGGGLALGVGFGLATGTITNPAGPIVGVIGAQRLSDKYMHKHHLFPKKVVRKKVFVPSYRKKSGTVVGKYYRSKKRR